MVGAALYIGAYAEHSPHRLAEVECCFWLESLLATEGVVLAG